MSISPSTLVSGFAFGSALLGSGVADPRIILGQLKLTDNRMLVVFLTGSSISAISVYLVQRMRGTELRPKPSIRLFGTIYAGNALGGLLIGTGMALSGACPGTMLVQASQGLKTGQYAVLGGLFGATLYSLLKRVKALNLAQPSDPSPSLAQSLHIRPASALAIYLSACATVIGLCLVSMKTTSLYTHKWPVHPLVGGLAIGTAQLVSLLLRGTSVGVSGVFGDIAEAGFKLLEGVTSSSSSKSKSHSNSTTSPNASSTLSAFFTSPTQFAIGLVLGSLALSRFYPSFSLSASIAPRVLQTMGVSPLSASLGGLLAIFGARLASGCTSGHGLSGTAQGAISSFITTAAMLGGGMAVMKVLDG